MPPVCTQSEFMEAWSKLFPDMSEEDKESTWVKMDADKSGTLEVAELAAFFGFNWEGEAATEMTDDQILEALQVKHFLPCVPGLQPLIAVAACSL